MKLFNKKLILCVCLIFVLAVPTAMAAKRYGGFITISVHQTDAHVRNFNPLNVETGRYQAQDWMYERMYIFNRMHPSKNFPWLATKYEIAKDLKSITFTLRQGVKWSDGETFDADDVIFTANLKKNHPELPEMPVLWGEDGYCSSIDKLGQYKVRFNYQKPNALAHLEIGEMRILPEHIWKDVKDPLHFTNENPVGTGPFTEVLEFKKTLFVLGKNKNYWQKGKPYIDGIRWPQYSSNEQIMAAAAKGELDWFSDFMENPQKEMIDKNPNMAYWFPPESLVQLHPNTTKKPFNNVEFRKAVSCALNRKDIVEIATFGITSYAVYPCGLGPFYASWFDHKKMEKYKYLMDYNPKKAKQILDKAGFIDKDGDGWRDNPDGTAISFKVSVPAGWTDWINTVMVITENLQDIKINARMHTPDEGAWFDTIATGDMDSYMMWNNAYTTPWQAYDELVNPSRQQPGAIQAQGIHQYKLPGVMPLMKEFTMTADLAKQKKVLGEIQELYAAHMPTIPLFAGAMFFEYNTERFEGFATQDNPFVRPLVWQGVPERLVHVLNLSLKDGAPIKYKY